MSTTRLYLYPIWVRMWHGINALAIVILIITGISMQYANLNDPLFSFNTTIKVHNFFGVLLAISYVFFFMRNIASVNSKHYRLKLSGLVQSLMVQANYYLKGYFKGEKKPFEINEDHKFNPLQKVAYVSVMYVFVPFMVISGFALLFPEMIVNKIMQWSGLQVTAFVHTLFGILIGLFLLIHLYVASIGKNPLKNYRSIINGYHED